jgi:hypothetical protein
MTLVNSHGKYCLVRWQSRWRKFAYRAIGVRKENSHFTVGFGIGKNNADVSVEELQVVIVSRDHDRAAPIPLPFPFEKPGLCLARLERSLRDSVGIRPPKLTP